MYIPIQNVELIFALAVSLIGGASVVHLITQGEKCFLKLHLINSLEEKNQEKDTDERS